MANTEILDAIRDEQARYIVDRVLDENYVYAFVCTRLDADEGDIEITGMNPLLSGMLFENAASVYKPGAYTDDADRDSQHGEDAD